MFFGAVQLGVMAACVVLFVPMGMAGYHLSRNKVLFFSGALFITLAVGVHLIPYFPSFSTLIPPSPSIVVSPDRNSCISLLHEIVYNVDSMNNDTDDGEESEGTRTWVSWDWGNSRADVVECEFQKLGRVDVSDLLNGSWVVVAGDSQARLFVVSLLNLVLGLDEMESVKGDLFKRHSDYRIDVGRIGLRLDFLWAPYVTNLTNVVLELARNNTYPDVLVMGAGLWHMLHFTNSSDYGASLGSLRESLASMIPVSSEFGLNGPALHRSPHLFWLGMPSLINTMLNTEEKREKMTEVMCDAYDRELLGSKLLSRHGGSFLLLDIQSLSRKCGARCSMDGMHYDATVYEASVHIMLNALLIESHQKL